jgi:hypothetical protein
VHLPHSGLRAPHDRLKVTDLERTPTHNWPAYTATLTLDGQPVGTLRNDGDGGDTVWAGDPDRWSPQAMADYTAACRHRGQPATEGQVLDALVTEADTDQAIRAAQTTGGTVARLCDAEGNIRELRMITPAPRRRTDLSDLGRTLTRRPDQQWEIWTGTRWHTVPGTVTG